MLKRTITIIILFVLNHAAADAQVVFRSLEEVWKYADVHNVTIKTAKYEIDKAVYSKKMAYGALLPQASATGSYTDNIELQTTLIPEQIFGGPAGAYRTLQFGQQFAYAGGVSAQMGILNLQNWFNVKIAKETEEMNRDSLANTRKNIYQQIASQYYSYLLMQEAARLAGQTAMIADSVYQSASNKFKEGTVDEANVDVAKLNLERAQQTQITSAYQARTANNNMKALLGLSIADSLRIDATLQNSLNTDGHAAFAEDPAIRVALLKTEISLSQLKYANSAFAPTINIVYNYATQRFDDKFEPFSGATGVAGWFPSQYWSLQASFPIFTGGTRFFQSKKNKVAYNESLLQYENTQNQSAINDENIRLNYQKAVAVLGKAEDVMKLSFDNFTHISNRYQAGITPIDDRLNAFRDYISYQNEYLNSLSDMLAQLYQVKIRQQAF